MDQPLLDFADPASAAEYLAARAELLKRHCAIAMANHQIAQHRDTERYQHVRSGSYLPRLRRFQIGDFVYAKRRNVVSTLQTDARPGIYRVAAVKDSGVLTLQGKCGGVFSEHSSNCAPCHLAGIDPTIDPSVYRPAADFPCYICGLPDDEHIMLLCDSCGRGYHTYCLEPALDAVPDDPVWICPSCTSHGVTVDSIAELQARTVVPEPEPVIFPTAAQQRLDETAQALHRRIVKVPLKGPPGTPKWLYGTLHFKGRRGARYPRYFDVLYTDGTTAQMTLRAAKKRLCAADAELPPAVCLSRLPSSLDDLPSSCDLTSVEGVATLLASMLPGHSKAQCQAAAVAFADILRDPLAFTGCVASIRDCQRLADCMDFGCYLQIAGLWVDHRPLRKFWAAEMSLTVQPALTDVTVQLSPSWFKAAQCPDCYYCCAPAVVLDVLLPLASRTRCRAVCAYVPLAYLADALPPRVGWLQRLHQAGRLALTAVGPLPKCQQRHWRLHCLAHRV